MATVLTGVAPTVAGGQSIPSDGSVAKAAVISVAASGSFAPTHMPVVNAAAGLAHISPPPTIHTQQQPQHPHYMLSSYTSRYGNSLPSYVGGYASQTAYPGHLAMVHDVHGQPVMVPMPVMQMPANAWAQAAPAAAASMPQGAPPTVLPSSGIGAFQPPLHPSLVPSQVAYPCQPTPPCPPQGTNLHAPSTMQAVAEKARYLVSTGAFALPSSSAPPPAAQWLWPSDALEQGAAAADGSADGCQLGDSSGHEHSLRAFLDANFQAAAKEAARESEPLREKEKVPKRAWTAEEDGVLVAAIARLGPGSWTQVAREVGFGRGGKQCRERWFNHLDPVVNKGDWTAEEDRLIEEGVRLYGSRWCEIVKLLPPGRSDNAVKNRYNSNMRKWKRAGVREERAAQKEAARVEKEAAKEAMRAAELLAKEASWRRAQHEKAMRESNHIGKESNHLGGGGAGGAKRGKKAAGAKGEGDGRGDAYRYFEQAKSGAAPEAEEEELPPPPAAAAASARAAHSSSRGRGSGRGAGAGRGRGPAGKAASAAADGNGASGQKRKRGGSAGAAGSGRKAPISSDLADEVPMTMEGAEIDQTLWQGAAGSGWQVVERTPGSWRAGLWTVVAPHGERYRSAEDALRAVQKGGSPAARKGRARTKVAEAPERGEADGEAEGEAAHLMTDEDSEVDGVEEDEEGEEDDDAEEVMVLEACVAADSPDLRCRAAVRQRG